MSRTFIIMALVIIVILGLIAMVTAIWNLIAAPETKKECDLKRIEQAYWCDWCGALGDKGVVSGYICECDWKSDKPGKCFVCETERVKAQWCRECLEVVDDEKIDVCVKTYYACAECLEQSFKPGKCLECWEEMQKVMVKCQIIYRCKDCGYTQYEPGKCLEDESAGCYGKLFTRTCQNSGTFPHIKE